MIGTKAWGGWKRLDTIRRCRWIAVCPVVVAMAASLVSQTVERPGRITQEIDSSRLVTLRGNVRQDLTADRDLGPVEDSMPLRLYLVLQRSPEHQADLDNLVARQQQATAPEYHQWLTPAEFGARFGASPADIAKITAWLEAQGMRVNGVMNNQMFIDVSTTAGQVRNVFQTPMHYWNLRGGKHAANAQDPMIPAALAGVVSGIKGLSKIPPMAMHTRRGQASYDAATHRWKKAESGSGPLGLRASPAFNNGPAYRFEEYDMTPQDYYTIYNVNKVFGGNANVGANAMVAVIEESDFEYGTVNASTGAASGGDLATFRSLFGVPGTLNLHVYHGYGRVTCNDPGIDPEHEGEESEAALDSEWANALAPSANLIVMSCDQYPDQGTFTSMAALIDNNLADAMSLSYGESEIGYTATDFSAQDALYEEAAAQGQSIFVAAGDGGSDVNDWVNGANTAVSGYNVNAYGAPMVTVAGGTDFSDFYDWWRANFAQASNCADGSATCTSWGSTYWGSTNTAYGDALSYVPETAWNDSCAGSLVGYLAGPDYTGAEYCGALTASEIDGTMAGGSGGFSTHYAVPAYQSGITGYSGSMRAQPDISAFASNGYWNHALIFCDSYSNLSDPNAPGSDGTPVTNCASSSTFGSAGGTSFVAPSLAGIAGLLKTATSSRQGLLNPALYALAKAQFTASATESACYSNGQTSNTGVTTGLPNSSECIFNDVTTGNNDVPCAADSTDCYVNSSGAQFGMLSLNGASSLQAAYASGAGYDEATGIGTLNVYNLITKWNTAFPSTTTLMASPTTIAVNGSTILSATVTTSVPDGSTYTPAVNGTVSFNAGSTALGTCTPSGGSCTLTVGSSALQSGANSITATFVSGSYATSTSSGVTVNVGTSLEAQTITFPQPATQTYGVGSITLAASASSELAVSYSVISGPASVVGDTLTITGVGSIVVQATQAGNSSYEAATPVNVTVMVNPAVLTVTANHASMVSGQTLPSFSDTMTGYVNGDPSSVVSGTATMTTTATSNSPAGTYPISFATELLTASNYTFNYVSGTLTISSLKAQTIMFSPPATQTYGVGSITLAATGGGSGNPVMFTVLSGAGTVSGSTLTIEGAGPIMVQATQSGNSSYAAATPVNVTVMVNPAVLTVTANNASMVSGQALPSFS
ncbi:MAG: protease pro-enzyme activation domain-containing protein, partial [Candidatus Korobacteraceae bacterium]